VYDRGPSDPVPYLRRDDPAPPRITAPTDGLGGWMRVSSRGVKLRLHTATEASPVLLPAGLAVRVLAATADHYRVVLPDGMEGLLRARDVVPAMQPLAMAAVAGAVREDPSSQAPVIQTIEDRTKLPVLARFGRFDLVRLPDARLGWAERALDAGRGLQ
jgi:hypothetical protein